MPPLSPFMHVFGGPGRGSGDVEGKGGGGREKQLLPGNFFSTRSTAPEQPPQLMVTVNMYLCSDMVELSIRFVLKRKMDGKCLF